MQNTVKSIMMNIDKICASVDSVIKTNSDKWKILVACYDYIKTDKLPLLSKRLFYIVTGLIPMLNEIKDILDSSSGEKKARGFGINDLKESNAQKSQNIICRREGKAVKWNAYPSKAEVADFIKKENLNVDAERFYHHYNAMGFRVLGNPIYDWRSKVLEWDMREKQKIEKQLEKERRAKEKASAKGNKSSSERKYTEEEIKGQNLFSDLDNIEI